MLFLEDWNKYPSAIIDYKTKNQSFIDIAILYKKMGIKNHAFPLALINPDLQGVDPFDPDLSIEQIAMIAIECKQNFWYFIREVVRIPGGSIRDPIRFNANRGNIALYWLFFNHITLILIQPRQTGKTFGSSTLARYLLNIRCTYTTINLLTKDDSLRSKTLEEIKDIETQLPYFLKQRNRHDLANTEKLTIKNLNNEYEGHLPSKSIKQALNVGRGLTSPIFQIDESAFLYNIGISLPAALASTTAAREMAKRKNEPYGVILTTTAGKKDDIDGRYIYKMVCDSAVWSEKFLDAVNQEDLVNLIRKNAPNGELRVNCTFNHRQLGFSDEWLREAIEISNATGDEVKRDFLNIWTSGSQVSPFTTEITKIIRDSETDTIHTEITSPYGYITRWYIPEEDINSRLATSNFIMGLDTSDAAGGDDIALTLRDIKTGEIVAAGNYNETNLITFAEFIVNWLVRFENITLVIERRSTGSSIIDYLLIMLPSKNINPFTRIYNKVVQEAYEDKERFAEINRPLYALSADIFVKYKKAFGFATSGTGATSRSELYGSTLASAAKLTGDKVNDKKVIDQILNLVIKNGRVDHPDGENDDLVISWLLSYWLLIHGKNLNHYGINSKNIMINNLLSKEENNPVTIYDNKQLMYVRSQIEYLAESIKNEKDEYVAYKLENKLKLFISQLTDSERTTLSIDELMNNIKESKRFK